MSWKEYRLDNRSIADWLPWEALTHPSIVTNKDDSIFAVLVFDPLPKLEGHWLVQLPAVRNGWSMWCETQHFSGQKQHFLCLCWNPFFRMNGSLSNALSEEKLYLSDMQEEFLSVMDEVRESVAAHTSCHLLEYQELIDFMEFTLSMGEHPVTMPDTPADLDALLSQDAGLEFRDNQIRMDDFRYFVYSLPGSVVDDGSSHSIFSALSEYAWRDVRRMLFFGDTEAKKELSRYTSRWCPGRKSILDKICDGLLSELNGYFTHALVVSVPISKEHEAGPFIDHLLSAAKIPYVKEDFNARDVWWGSLPSLFRANIRPPIIGVSSVDVLMPHEGGEMFVSSQSV